MKITEEFKAQLLELGFEFNEDDEIFPYEKELVSDEELKTNNITRSEAPCLVYGDTGINSGFCVFTGEGYIWLNIETPKEAVKFAEKIKSFERYY